MAIDQIPNRQNAFRVAVPSGQFITRGTLEVANATNPNDAINSSALGTLLGGTITPGTPYIRVTTGIVLSGGTKVTADTSVTANTVVIPVVTTSGGTVGSLKVSTSAGVSYTITSSNGAETSTVTAILIG